MEMEIRSRKHASIVPKIAHFSKQSVDFRPLSRYISSTAVLYLNIILPDEILYRLPGCGLFLFSALRHGPIQPTDRSPRRTSRRRGRRRFRMVVLATSIPE